MLVLRPTLHPGQPFVCPINVSAARKGSEGGLFNIKSIEPFSAFLSAGGFWGTLLSHSPNHLKYFAASFTKGSQIDKEKTLTERESLKGIPGVTFLQRLIDVCRLLPSSLDSKFANFIS